MGNTKQNQNKTNKMKCGELTTTKTWGNAKQQKQNKTNNETQQM